MMENSPQMADFSRNIYLWGCQRQVELISSQPSRGTSSRRDESKDRKPKKSHFTRKIQEKLTARETQSWPVPTDQKHTTFPLTNHMQHIRNTGNLASVTEKSPLTHSLLSFSDQPVVTWIVKSPQHHLTKHESHDGKPALLSSPSLPNWRQMFSSKATKCGCLLWKQRDL